MKRILVIFGVFAGLFVAMVAGLLLWWIFGEQGRIHNAAVASAHLAKIPDPNYRAVTSGSLFSRTYWIDFQCSEGEFDRFLRSSAGLREVTPYHFPFAETDPIPTTWDKPPEYTRSMMRKAKKFWWTDSPLWNASQPRRMGRRFEITIPDEAIHGFLLRDDETGDVSLRVSYS